MMVTEPNFSADQRELYELMSDISEDAYYAGWYTGNEYHIWAALHDGNRRYGVGEMDPEQLQKVRELAARLNGWIIWWDDRDEPGLHCDYWGPRFVSTQEWHAMLAKDNEARK